MIFRNLSALRAWVLNTSCQVVPPLLPSYPIQALINLLFTILRLPLPHWLPTSFGPLPDSPCALTLLARLLSSGCLSYPSHAPQVLISSSEPPPHRDSFLTLFVLRFPLLCSPTTWMLASYCLGCDAPCQDAFL